VLSTAVTAPDDRPTPEITVFWRPGCPFCGSLFRQLEREGVEHRRVNIWDDPDAAATVRSIARGNETVPTVLVGGVGLVNPSLREIQAALAGA
jgi:mycoredoxin